MAPVGKGGNKPFAGLWDARMVVRVRSIKQKPVLIGLKATTTRCYPDAIILQAIHISPWDRCMPLFRPPPHNIRRTALPPPRTLRTPLQSPTTPP